MEEGDFPTSPSKRRRTESPAEEATSNVLPGPEDTVVTQNKNIDIQAQESLVSPGADENKEAEGNKVVAPTSDSAPDLLNVLMAEVEAQSRSGRENQNQQEPTPLANSDAEVIRTAEAQAHEIKAEEPHITGLNGVHAPQGAESGTIPGTDLLQPAETAAEAAAETPSEAPEEREWETDSSPYSSSTDSSDDSSDEESDEAGDNDYPLLSPTEQARILMEDAGSDDEGAKGKSSGAGLRTAHEMAEEIIPKPDITVTSEMQIEELGTVEAIVEGTVLIKGKTTGEYRVLEYGSLLCLEDRSVIGVIADTVGRVQQPLYTVRFASDEAVAEAGVAQKGTRVFYVVEHSTFVFTEPLKGAKGSDASNFHDEEVGDDEMEFSDDEKEAEHKRILKLRKKGVDVDSMGPHGGRGAMHSRGGRGGSRGGRGRGGFQPSLPMHPENAIDSASHATSLNYDDGDGGDYEPLRRAPSTYNQDDAQGGNSHQQAEQPRQDYAQPNNRRFDGRRGNDQRGRRGNRGGGGGFQPNRSYQNNFQQNSYQSPQMPQPQQWGFNQQQQQQQPQQWVPPFPQLLPGMPNFFNQAMAPAATTPTTTAATTITNPGGLSFGQPLASFLPQNGYPSQGYNNHQPMQQYGAANSWNANQAAVQQVARQLEELRRASGNGGSQGGGSS